MCAEHKIVINVVFFHLTVFGVPWIHESIKQIVEHTEWEMNENVEKLLYFRLGNRKTNTHTLG